MADISKVKLKASGTEYNIKDATARTSISSCYATGDTAETALADGDYIPFYDTSASGKRKTLWSNIKSVLKTYFDTLYTKTVANPTGTATGTLTKLGIGSDIYDIQGGGGITKTITVYSAAVDTVTFTDLTGSKTVTTNANGVGTVSINYISGQIITFTSSVAKNPDDLSEDYSKQIQILEDTTAVYVMPNKDTLYWFGYISSNFEDMTAANGWSRTGYTFTAPTHNTNNYTCTVSSASQYSYMATKTPVKFNKVHLIGSIDNETSFYVRGSSGKNLDSATYGLSKDFEGTSISYHVATVAETTDYLWAGKHSSPTTVNCTINAFWYGEDDNQKNIGKLKDKRVVLITDSYGAVTSNFIDQMRSMCPDLRSDNFYPFPYSSAGFVGDLVSGQHISWKQRFIDSGDINTVPEPSTITDVLILGGSNDRGNGITVSDIMSAAQTFYGLVSNVFTNANIYVGYIGYSVNYLAGDAVLSTKRAYQSLGVYGYRPIAHANSWLHYTGYITDNVHPNADGSKLIATGVLNTIIGGGTDDIFNHEPTPVGLTFETGFSSVSQANTDRWVIYHYGHRSGIKVLGEFAFGTAVVRCNSSYTKFATIGDTYIYGANDNFHVCNCFINVGINSKNYTLPCVVKLFNKGLYIKFPPHEDLPSATSYNVTYATLYFGGIEADDIFI